MNRMPDVENLGGGLGRVLLIAGAAFVALAHSGAPIQAQVAVEVLSACYIPGTGTLYLVDQDGLPDACIRDDHALLQWNEEGLVGDEGPQGRSGLMCWDVDADGVPDPSEDRDGNGVYDAEDCQGDPGAQGPTGTQGLQGAVGDQGPQGVVR
jgi:hypothetical protein